MQLLQLVRSSTSPEGTFGLLTGDALQLHTGELPWHNNAKTISCIPTGCYLCKPHQSKKYGSCFWLQDVPGRSEILIHAANYMGDAAKGYRCHLQGCIALGMDFGLDTGPNDQDMILSSRVAVNKLLGYTDFKPFWLNITNNTDVEMDI